MLTVVKVKLTFYFFILLTTGWSTHHVFGHPVPLQSPHLLWQLLLCHAKSGGCFSNSRTFCHFHQQPCGGVFCWGYIFCLSPGDCVGTQERHPGLDQGQCHILNVIRRSL